MYKSNHNYNRFNDIPVEELTNFINPIKTSIPVDKECLSELFRGCSEVRDYVNGFYDSIFNYIPSMPEDAKTYFIRHNFSISYTPHTSGHDFRFSPIDFFNELFKFMKLDYQIPFVNLDNGYGMNYLKDYVRAFINDFKRDDSQKSLVNYPVIVAILDEVNSNLDQICHMYFTDLDNMIKNFVIPKDMLLYLAYKSLSMYEKTKDEMYLVLPYEYYTYVSHMNTSPYPHMIYFEGNRVWFNEFRDRYSASADPHYQINDNKYILDDHELLLSWDILKPGMLERQIRDTSEFVRSVPNVDYDKYMKLFETKINYYMNSPYVNYIQGKYGLLGYVGFSYKNEYLIFDKFHNSETIDPSKKTILTHGEAIYALPSDRVNVVKGDKQKIIEAKKTDLRIKKVNHTPNYSFLTKLDGIIASPNVSYTTFDKVIEQEKKKMLIKN